MKFLAALVHAAAAASSQAGAGPLALVFDSLAPRDAEGEVIFLYQNRGVQFRSPPAAEGCDTASGSGDIDCTIGLKLEFVNFTVRTIHLPTNASMWLQADLCPSVEGNQTPICSRPNTTYSFTAFSNGETLDDSPIWLNGAKEFTNKNDPNADVRVAYKDYPGGPWLARIFFDPRKVPSLQVYTS
ncbi:hypothetical protein DYB37_013167 [Aphanomyces astaci]|uniref:Uncharacterized protein n=1 Tax=Aphanomyces astaci TaxID=112090 RepID=A0A397BNV0_APHAT|nr:hypothetical protein DYB36_011380 [Aphanomyces astaci]RHY81988.1 hypothetical protein DYB35_012718 [Aphanomyces astaci]RHZ24107.1 hypothetical protein DYB31_009829 [Aphanomyces astaci]RHZ33675.1 hypothetical protein DYB37_013167 [Aphanomyces astaci]